jgi:hypothetical protein
MCKSLWSICAVVVFASAGAFAADGEVRPLPKEANAPRADAKGGEVTFDTRIDTWVEGTVLSIDADGAKLGVRGVKLPYATAMAGMWQDIHNQTKDLNAADRKAKEDEVRRAWADRLAKSRDEKVADKTSDYTFALPANGQLSMYNANEVKSVEYLGLAGAREGKSQEVAYEKDARKDTGDVRVPAKLDEKEFAALKSLKDLKVGDRVQIGFDDGVVTDEVYVLVKK